MPVSEPMSMAKVDGMLSLSRAEADATLRSWRVEPTTVFIFLKRNKPRFLKTIVNVNSSQKRQMHCLYI